MTEKQLTYYKGRYKDPKWISYNKKIKKYYIYRTIHNVRTYFGSYDTLEEAERVVAFLNKNNWDKNKLKEIVNV